MVSTDTRRYFRGLVPLCGHWGNLPPWSGLMGVNFSDRSIADLSNRISCFLHQIWNMKLWQKAAQSSCMYLLHTWCTGEVWQGFSKISAPAWAPVYCGIFSIVHLYHMTTAHKELTHGNWTLQWDMGSRGCMVQFTVHQPHPAQTESLALTPLSSAQLTLMLISFPMHYMEPNILASFPPTFEAFRFPESIKTH